MGAFKLTDNYVKFANAVAKGMPAYKAYTEHVATKKDLTKQSATATASRLVARPQIQEIIKKAQEEIQRAIITESARVVAAEFSTEHLTDAELDSFHYAVIQGKVMVEEIVPTFSFEYDKDGKVIKRARSFAKITRFPNIREKQFSVDAIYKRKGLYAPGKFWHAHKNVPDGEEQGEGMTTQRFIMLSNGEKLPL